MPQIGIGGEEVRTGSVFDAPKLEPAFKDERARVMIPNPEEVFMNFRHSVGGQRAAKGAPPGTPVPTWGGNWICTGRYEVLRDSNPHSDPEACVMCRKHKDGDPLVDKATRKWVMQIFRYSTSPDGQQLVMPFTVRLFVWMFSDREFGQLSEIKKAWGDIRQYDLQLTALSKDWKTWDVSVLPQALWLTQQDWITYVQEAYSQQHIGEDLESLIGRRASNDNEILAKIEEVRLGGQPQQQGYPMGAYPGQPGQVPPQYFPGQAPPQYAPQQPYGAPPVPPVPDLQAPPPLAAAMAPPQQPQAPQQLTPQVPPLQVPPPAMAPPAAAPAAVGGPVPQAPPVGVPGQFSPPAMPQQPQQQAAPPPLQAPAAVPPVQPPGPPAAPPETPAAVDFNSLLQVPGAPPAAPPQQ